MSFIPRIGMHQRSVWTIREFLAKLFSGIGVLECLALTQGKESLQQPTASSLQSIQHYRKEISDMQVKQYEPGETIIAEGTHGTDVFVITSGQVLICKETGRKGRIPIATLGEGEVFGEMHLLDEAGFRSATVMAKTAVTLEIIPKDEMEKHLENTPPIVLSILKTLSKRLAATSQENSILKFHEGGMLNKLFGKKPAGM